MVVVFEGRDAAGKGGTIKAIVERISPRVFRVVALPAPSDRAKSQLYMQRYLRHFPAAGEIVIFDRSWYNRAGVEHVMGFCSKAQHERFLVVCPEFERYVVDDGVLLLKYWLEVSDAEQKRRFEARITDPLRQWKLSPTDLCGGTDRFRLVAEVLAAGADRHGRGLLPAYRRRTLRHSRCRVSFGRIGCGRGSVTPNVVRVCRN